MPNHIDRFPDENEQKDNQGLRILIVGAGIAGLTAAIALRKQGHEVLIFEQAQSASEDGAAVHLTPNANGILKRLGVFANEFGANNLRHGMLFSKEGRELQSMNLDEFNKLWQHQWLLADPARLNATLRTKAVGADGPGRPVIIHTSSNVVDVDVDNAALTLRDGQIIKGDVVLGADGVHSATRAKIHGNIAKPYGSGKSVFQFSILKESVIGDPEIAEILESPSQSTIWYGADRRVIISLVDDNRLLNFVCIHPDAESKTGDGWNTTGNLEQLLSVYKEFSQGVLNMLGKADPATLKVWKLFDMEVMPTWVNKKLALLGDAAHPFDLNHIQNQGSACGIEDAASLGVVFPLETPKSEIVERLQLYEKIRHERACRLQEYSRVERADLVGDGSKMDMRGSIDYNFGHDEWDNSTQNLREWTWARTPSIYWRMPIAFGPMPGPRQTAFGVFRNAEQSTFKTASIKFKTSRTLLQNLFPRNTTSYRFKSPGTFAYASFTQTTLNKMEWLGGSGYHHIGLYIHGVEYVKKNCEIISGTYMPILFESLTDPIVSGREELGMPKLYTAIDVSAREKSHRISTSWQGAHWGSFTLEGLREADLDLGTGSVSGENDDGILTYRYMPQVGRGNKGVAETEYPVFVPFADERPVPVTKRVRVAAKASFKIDALDWESLPTLHHVISRLAELPVYEIVSAKIVDGVGVPDVGAAIRIE